jgi:predicted flap endonuclease-1-like 5' DNA nuclease
MVMNTQEVLLQQPKTKYTDTMQPILDLLTRLVVALELIAAKSGNGVAPVAVTTVESEPETKPAPAPKGKAKAPAKEEPKVDFEALRSECKDTITALVESGRKDAAKKVLAAHGVAKLAELADEKLPDIKADLAKLEEEDLS